MKWTGRYWMTKVIKKKITLGLKKYYKKHFVWNKWCYNPTYDEPSSKRFRRNLEYYLKELEKNAKRNIGKKLTKKRSNQIIKWRKQVCKLTGTGRKRRMWNIDEIEFLKNNYRKMFVVDMALKLNRSFASVEHKLCRLGLIYYHKWNKRR